MNLGFSNLIAAIEAEIEPGYMPGAIQWCDEQLDNAWSKAMDRFDGALRMAIERKDYVLAQSEGEFYRATIMKLLSKYKAHKGMDEAKSFLSSLSAATG
jgi:hypothetical protein